jgi:hypothetical protein
MGTDQLTNRIIGAAMKVHSALGPGLLESAYGACLYHELRKQGLQVRKEVALPVSYDGIQLDVGYRIDLLVEEKVVVATQGGGEGATCTLRAVVITPSTKRSPHRTVDQLPCSPFTPRNQSGGELNPRTGS